jgi:cytidine deaminase
MSNKQLIDAAEIVRKSAYAPYSNFTVGAALLSKGGKIFTGCNIENVSLGLTICAERSAVAAAVSACSSDFVAIAVVTSSKKPVVPCGACRQVLAEFSPSMQVLAATEDGLLEQFELSDLLPRPRQGIMEVDSHV